MNGVLDDVVADPVIANAPAPLSDLRTMQLSAAMRIGLNGPERLQHLLLDRPLELAEVTLEYL